MSTKLTVWTSLWRIFSLKVLSNINLEDKISDNEHVHTRYCANKKEILKEKRAKKLFCNRQVEESDFGAENRLCVH